MATNPNDTHARRAIGKFARALLATTCLTVASGAAVAGTINYNEGNSPAPADFSNTFAGASVSALTAAGASGVTVINGATSNSDRFDYIELTGLGSGTFTVDVVDSEGNGPNSATIFNDSGPSGTNIGGPTAYTSSTHAFFSSQAIPADGDLVIELDNLGETSNNYTVTVTATAPEPGTLATLGLGLAGAAALKRRRRKQS